MSNQGLAKNYTNQLIANLIMEFVFCCVINIFRKYALVVLLKDRKGITIPDAFQKI